MRKYGQPESKVERIAQNLTKRIGTRLVGMAMSIRQSIPRGYMREILQLDYFSAYLRPSLTGPSE